MDYVENDENDRQKYGNNEEGGNSPKNDLLMT
jgi:hypothetical protein